MGPKAHSSDRAAAYGAGFLGHATDARQLQRMHLHDLAKRSTEHGFVLLGKLLVASGHARAVDQ